MKNFIPVARSFAYTTLSVGFFALCLSLSTEVRAASISPQALPPARVGTPYSMTLQLQDMATTTMLSWGIVNGILPPNLSLEPMNNGQSAQISGRPITPGNNSFRLQLMSGTQVVYEQPMNLIVLAMDAATSSVIILPNGQVGIPFSYTFPMMSGTAPFTWTVTSGVLPFGLSLNPSGMITGTPTATSSADVTFQVTDATGHMTSYPLTFLVNSSVFSITTDMLSSGIVGTNYTAQLTSTGGIGAQNWTLASGSLPPGLMLESTGRIQGTPTVAGTYTLTFNTHDANGQIVSRQLQLRVNPTSSSGLPLMITSPNMVSGMVGSLYTFNLNASGGIGPYSWRITSGALPTGMQIGTNGAVSGVPTLPGTYSFTLEATDAQNTRVSQPYLLTIQPSIGSSPAELDARLQTLRGMGIDVHSLVKLPDDQNRDTQVDSAVYYIGTDGRRHAFPHEQVFFTWYGNFLGIRILSASDLSRIQLGSNVTYKPGTRMVKFPSDTRVYAVSPNRTLRWIPSEALAQAIYGSSWNRRVSDVPSAFMMDYIFGTDIGMSSEYIPSTVQSSIHDISETLPTL